MTSKTTHTDIRLPAQSKSVSDAVAQALQEAFTSGRFKPGELCPGQRELAKQLGVSRTALREAVSTLEALGYVRTIPGKGTVVTYGTDSALPARDLAKADSGNLSQIAQFRLSIEPNTAYLVGPTLSLEQKNHLLALQNRLEDGVRARDLVASSAADAEFHIYLASLTGNPYFMDAMSTIHAGLKKAVQLPFADADRLQFTVQEHKAIVEALLAGDGLLAKKAMAEHLLTSARYLGIDIKPLSGD